MCARAEALWIVKKARETGCSANDFVWRPLSLEECGMLQGIDRQTLRRLGEALLEKLLRLALGNAMSRPVLEDILMNLFILL